jgi:hypothetical protein
MDTITKRIKRVQALLDDDEHVKICPDCVKTKATECSRCGGIGFVNSDGSSLTKKKAEFIGQVAADIDELSQKNQQPKPKT